MAKGTATLKKITTRAKALKKKHPKAKWTSLVKKAGAEFRAGKLGRAKPRKKRHSKATHAVKRRKVGVRKHAVKRHHAVKRRKARKRAKRPASAVVVISAAPKKRKRSRKKSYKPVKNVTHCRRVGAAPTNWGKIALIGGAAIVALYAFSRPSTTVLTPAAQAAGGSNILAYATAAGASATAIANLVSKLNGSTPAQVQTANLQLASTSQLPSDWASVITAGAGPSTTNTALATSVLSSDE